MSETPSDRLEPVVEKESQTTVLLMSCGCWAYKGAADEAHRRRHPYAYVTHRAAVLMPPGRPPETPRTAMPDQPSLTADSTPLTIELVPSTCWFSNVRSHVPRADWEICKRFVRQRSGDRCEVCGGRGQRWPVECHEVWSYHEAVDRDVVTLRVQRLDGLIALCPACHEVKHIGLAEIRGRLPMAVDHLARVNGWTADDALAYVESCVEVWAQRSQHEWELDVSWLATIGVTVPSSPSR